MNVKIIDKTSNHKAAYTDIDLIIEKSRGSGKVKLVQVEDGENFITTIIAKPETDILITGTA